jgi:hypothetical protein
MISPAGLVAQYCRIANSVVINCFTLILISYITKSSQHHITTALAVITKSRIAFQPGAANA